MPAFVVFMGLLLVALAGVVGYYVGRSGAERQAVDRVSLDAVRREVADLRSPLDRIKDTAWDHRELDSALSTIIIDEIRTYERRELE